MDEDKSQRKIELLRILAEGCHKHPAYRARRPATRRCQGCAIVWDARVEMMILEISSLKGVTPKREDVSGQRSRKPAFRFSMVGIAIGSELRFLRDETITCRVANDSLIEFRGQSLSLSKVTLGLLNNRFNKNLATVRGPNFWVYENETLTERRLRMESEELARSSENT